MQTQYKDKPIVLLVIFTMVICIVFASSLKVATDLANMAKKNTSLQLLEEEPNEKDNKLCKEVYNKYNSFSESIEMNKINISSNAIFHSLLKLSSPYFKIHTPPPDFLILLN
ncbi:hypothetical protein [Wenyingzhuangia sp. IMCC45467]